MKNKLIGKEIKFMGGTVVVLYGWRDEYRDVQYLSKGKKYKVLKVHGADITTTSDIEGKTVRTSILHFDRKTIMKYWGQKITKSDKKKSLKILMSYGGSEKRMNYLKKEYDKLSK